MRAFSRLAGWTATAAGHPIVTILAISAVLIWIAGGVVSGRLFDSQYQLLINSGTTICTFVLVFIIQATQNAHDRALHLKLDELIRANEGAHDEFMALERQTHEDLDAAEKALNQE